jgi:hypothetical protein
VFVAGAAQGSLVLLLVRNAAFKPISPRLCRTLRIEQKEKEKKERHDLINDNLEATVSSFLS